MRNYSNDFGTSDDFVGVMKGVILRLNPQATIVDITHDIAPQNVEQGAFLFANAVKYFPVHAIHVVVVDPGVGSARRPIAAQLVDTFFVAPDNGVLSSVLRPAERSSVRIMIAQIPRLQNRRRDLTGFRNLSGLGGH